MSRNARLLGLILFFLSISFGLSGQDEDIYNYKNSLLYADHLYGLRQYKAAAREYERVLFLNPQEPSLHERLISSYFSSGDFSTGISRTHKLYPTYKGMTPKLAFVYSKSLLLVGEEKDFSSFISNSTDLTTEDRTLLEVGNHLLTKNWGEAQSLYHNLKDQNKRMMGYQSVIALSEQVKRKKPGLALALSTFLPGLGRIYTRQWKDGVISFALIGGLSYASYRNFNNQGRSRALGWIYGSLAMGFYAGNLYGSYQSAHRFNDNKSTKIIDETLLLLHRNL